MTKHCIPAFTYRCIPTLDVAGVETYRRISSPNYAVVFAEAARVTYRSRPVARLAFLAGGASKVGAGLGGLFGRLNLRGEMFPGPVPTLLSSGPKEAALFPAAELTRWISQMQVRAVGAYLPRLDQEGMTEFIRESVERFKETLYKLNQTSTIHSDPTEIEARALELPEELDYDLQRCALFELEVTANDSQFDPSEYGNLEADQLGWAPAFLTPDGEEILDEFYKAPASLKNFRVAFYVHEWPENGRLSGPSGQLELPAFTAVPKRLWKLAPYSCVD